MRNEPDWEDEIKRASESDPAKSPSWPWLILLLICALAVYVLLSIYFAD